MTDPVPNTSSAVIARLRAWAAAKGWTKSRFAAEAGVVDTTLRNFGSPNWNPTVETLEKLEAVLPRDWQPGDPVPAAADTEETDQSPREEGSGDDQPRPFRPIGCTAAAPPDKAA